jgi:general secretion pathway protein L
MLAFLHWWLEQLAGLIPESIRRQLTQPRDALVIEMGEQTLAATRRRHGRLTPLGRFVADDAEIEALAAAARASGRSSRVILRPPASWFLKKRLSLPLAARSELRRILAYEMERETPFTLDEIWWRYALRRVDRTAKTLDIDITVLPRALAAPMLERLRRVGLVPTALELDDAAEARCEIALDNAASAGNRGMWRVKVATAAAAGVLVLATAFVFIRQEQRLAAAETELNLLKSSAGEAAALRQQIDRATEAGDEIAAAREEAGSPLAALAAATRLLPDDAYLTDFSFHHRRLTMTGLSPAAAELVGALANTPPFKAPALAAPIVRNEASGLESFTIKAAFGEAKSP